MRIRTEQIIDVGEWDKLVIDTYKRPYSFQQQNDCYSNGSFFSFTVPGESQDEDFPDSCLEQVNGPDMGIKFAKWLERDPKSPLADDETPKYSDDQWRIDLWYHRNFYPDIHTLANDLHAKGLLPAGDYNLDISW